MKVANVIPIYKEGNKTIVNNYSPISILTVFSKVIPIYKGGNKTIVNNYRAMSILTVFSTVLEILMYNRLTMFINKHNSLYDYQFGFRNKYFASMALGSSTVITY